MPLVASIEEGLARHAPEVVVDLSDEPVLGPAARFRLASRALAGGLPYVGADFRFDPPAFEPFPLPSLAVIGTGKRVGKTAVTGHLARLLARDRDVVVVAMGRGGPPEPELVEAAPTRRRPARSARARAGTRPPTTSRPPRSPACRRSAAGAAAAVSPARRSPRTSRRRRGSLPSCEPDIVVFDGSGAAIPPVATGRADPGRRTTSSPGLNPYRALISDLVLTMSGEVAAAAEALGRARSASTCACGRRAARRPADGALHDRPGPSRPSRREIVFVSRNLADREALRRDLAGTDAEVYLVELKAAAIDVVAEAAAERGAALVLARNDVVAAASTRRSAAGLAAAADIRREFQAMTERRRADPLPLGGDGLPYSKGLLARVLMVTGVPADRAYELALRVEQDLVARGETTGRPRPARGARAGGARRERGRADAPPAAPLRAAARARRAADPADRRRDRHRQVDGRDRGRLPARDHARQLDRLRPPDDARVPPAGLHALDPPLELRGAGRATSSATCSDRSSSRRRTC